MHSCTTPAMQPVLLAIDIAVLKDCAEDDVRDFSHGRTIADYSSNGHRMQPACKKQRGRAMSDFNDSAQMPLRGFTPPGQLPPQPSTPAATPTRSRKVVDEFTGSQTAVQFRLPADLVLSLRLQSFDTGRSMSDLCFEALTTETVIAKSWVSSRRSAG